MTFITLLIFGFVCAFFWSLVLETKDKLDPEKYTEETRDAASILLMAIFVTLCSLLTSAIL